MLAAVTWQPANRLFFARSAACRGQHVWQPAVHIRCLLTAVGVHTLTLLNKSAGLWAGHQQCFWKVRLTAQPLHHSLRSYAQTCMPVKLS
jgi:hypothetical protein